MKNDNLQYEEIYFNDLIEAYLKEKKKILDKRDNIILNFNNELFDEKILKLAFEYIFETDIKKIILRNILEQNYEYIKKLQVYFQITKNI
ncbi:hypothetical protein [Fusobacterium polymorphum]|jgi:hypothetical protein|uniref:hypothetical protein n=1 Tax=Fusobacterium nucleatum subsp. polymorphum TaxID=76857 RepID=UPI0030D4D87C